jgi:hypothetical protein
MRLLSSLSSPLRNAGLTEHPTKKNEKITKIDIFNENLILLPRICIIE